MRHAVSPSLLNATVLKTAVLTTVLWLGACASVPPAQVDAHFAGWQSAQINELIQAWGVPQQSREVVGKHYAEWTKQDVSSSPRFSIGLGGWGGNVGGGVGTSFGGGDQHNFCSVQAEHDADGRVHVIRWNGNTDICVEQFAARTH